MSVIRMIRLKMTKTEYEGFRDLVGLLYLNGYKFHTFEFTDLYGEWSIDLNGNPTGIKKYGLRLVINNKVVSPQVEIDTTQLKIIKDIIT